MKWLKKWSYLLMMVGSGIVYLSYVDNWKVYAEPLKQLQTWWDELGESGAAMDSKNGGQMAEVWAYGEKDTAFGEENGTAVFGEQQKDGSAADEMESDNKVDVPVTVTGNEKISGVSEDMTGSGNSSEASGEVTGSGSSSGVSGSGNSSNVPGDVTYYTEVPGGEDSTALPEVTYMTVEDDYFADAVFIGDSRTVGMFEYGGLEETAAFYASTGLTVYKMFDAEIVSVPGERKKITVEEALQRNSFSKIYLMIGINEMGTGTVESFLEKYAEVVEHLQELQPDAVIYLQAILKVTAERSAKGDYINNEGIEARNEGIAALADNRTVFFLDVNPEICDESGGMNPDYTFDGVHLKAKYIEIWKDYLKTHAIFS